jgi:hypothetical protein
MNKTLKINILNIFLVLIILSFNVYAVTLSDQGTDVKLTNGSTLELGNLSVKIYDNTTSGSLIFSQNFTNAIINGSWNVMLTNVSLEYGKNYYKDYLINDDDLSFDSNDRIMFTSPLGVISSEDILNSGIYDVDIYNLSYSKITTCGSDEILKYVNGNWTCSNETDTQWNITTSYYLVNNSGVLIVNETLLNATIDARSTNLDTNRSDADILLVASVYNETDLINSMYNLSLSDFSTNLGNWSDDKSDYYNTTQVDSIVTSLNDSWKTNATSQLNLINSIIGDNVSWNESYANSLYLGINDQTYNETSLIVSVNNSWKANATEQLTLINSMDNLSLSDVTNNIGNWSQDKPNYWNTSTTLNLTNNVSVYLTGNVSSDNFFGNLNFSYIENVPGYSLISNLVSYLGNWSNDKSSYYNKTEIDTISDTINSSWKSNATEQLTLINSMDNLSLSDVSNNIGNWSKDKLDYWNTSTTLNLTNNVSVYLTGNVSSDNFFGNLNFSYIENVPGYSLISNLVGYLGNWSNDKSTYYNKTEIDTISDTINSSWKSNATEQLTLINSMDNLSLSDVSNNVGNWSANQSRYMLNDGDTATGNYTFNNTLLHIDATNDRIGIGTTNPSHELNVIGDVNITGDLYVNSSSVYLGDKKLSNENGELQYDGKNVTPNGMVVAFNSATCPTGWIPANGSDGTPDLRGIFIRGAGNNSVLNSNASFGEYYNDSFEEHSHGDGSLDTSTIRNTSSTVTGTVNTYDFGIGSFSTANEGSHTHNSIQNNPTYNKLQTFAYLNPGGANYFNAMYDVGSTATTGAGSDHSHTILKSNFDHGHTFSSGSSTDGTWNTTISGSTSTNGTTQTIPNSYALTYCIKDPGSDYAEWIESDETIKEAMIVSVDKTSDNKVVKTKKEYDNTILGIVSTKPGWIIGSETKTTVKLALAGQVHVKVTLHNGEINRGDAITSSSLEGYGMKATEDKRIVGIALSELNNNSKNVYKCEESLCGTIKILLDLSWRNEDTKKELQNQIQELKQEKDFEISELKQENEFKQKQIDEQQSQISELIGRMKKIEIKLKDNE